MKLNSPLPQSLSKECTKAAKIFRSFVDSGNNGLDGVIPRSVLQNAKGFAIFTIFKAGFLFSARAGSGIVIAKLNDGSWSAPSAIGTAGVGVGGQAGAEMTDFLVVLNTRAAIRSFMAAGSLTLGGNMSIALGPLGRNGEASGSLSTSGKMAAMYSYSKTRGLFGGISIEGSVIVERQDANSQAYRSPVTAKLLLGGAVEPPSWAMPLIRTLDSCTGMPGAHAWIEEGIAHGTYAFGGVASPGAESSRLSRRNGQNSFPPETWGNADSDPFLSDEVSQTHTRSRTWDQRDSTHFETRFDSDYSPEPRRMPHPELRSPAYRHGSHDLDDADSVNPFDPPQSSLSSRKPKRPAHVKSISTPHAWAASSKYNDFVPSYSLSRSPNYDLDDDMDSLSLGGDDPPIRTPKPELVNTTLPPDGIARAIALFDFTAVESGDLSFSKGDVIVITERSDSTDDWWAGRIGLRRGVFPANFVEVV